MKLQGGVRQTCSSTMVQGLRCVVSMGKIARGGKYVLSLCFYDALCGLTFGVYL